MIIYISEFWRSATISSKLKLPVRQVARNFGVSKSTVHKDITERLPQINLHLAGEIKKILEKNKAERHLRGGEATRRKYLSLKGKFSKFY